MVLWKETDTGGTVSVLPEKIYKQAFSDMPLASTDVLLKNCNQGKINHKATREAA